MRKIALFLTILTAPLAATADEVEAFLRQAELMRIESYQASEEAKAIAREGFENRARLSERDQERLSQAEAFFRSDAFQEQQAKWRNDIASWIGADAWESESGNDEEGEVLPYSERPILFASSSVPMRTLRNYARDLEKVGGVMVFRGFVGGVSQVTPTLKLFGDILKKDASCKTEPCDRRNVPILIDPIIFREYGVNVVPALAIHGQTNLAKYCKGTEGLNPSSTIVYGDSSIKYLAQRLFEETGMPEHRRIVERL